MDKNKSCLKGFYIFFNVLLGLAGCGLIIRVQMSLQHMDLQDFNSETRAISWIRGLGGAMIILCGLGVWGACKEKSFILGIYIGGTIAGAIVLLILGIKVALVAPATRSVIIKNFDGLQKAMKRNVEIQKQVQIIEREFECCGIKHYADWGSNIPQSCLCPSQYQNTDRCTTAVDPFDYDASYMLHIPTEKDFMKIYREPCGPKVVHFIKLVFDICLGLIFGFVAFKLLLLLMTLALLCVIKKKREALCVTEEAIPISLEQDPRFWLYPQVPNQDPNLTLSPPPYSLFVHPMPSSPIQDKVFG